MEKLNSTNRSHGFSAMLCFLIGVGLLVHSAFQPADFSLAQRIGPAVVALTFALLFWGLLTVRNIVQLVALIRGQSIAENPIQGRERNTPRGGDK